MTLDDIIETFDFLDEWEDRYKYLIDLGKSLPPYNQRRKTVDRKVNGCVSNVWLDWRFEKTAAHDAGQLIFQGESDALIVKGLIAVVFAIFSAKSPAEILATDSEQIIRKLGLSEHLTPQRANGLRALMTRIVAIAEKMNREQNSQNPAGNMFPSN